MAAVLGVIQIRNTIEVSPADAAEHVTEHVVSVLEHDARAEGRRLSMSADGSGHVIVEGTARSVAESAEIEKAALGADGVTSVSNRLHLIT
ncbi:BON domain-containing protein [Rhodococcus sp. G-MC3]|uniref:BON domain-containing protein n=1 Tax=Rhodococcus sp. G-MC3 TaxID=3046209 RepID=UPI0024BB4638|nr:BON domain-containing protein [Rhodococcus sp. G-MC3]MDJ0396473.1 BON domain-containing protein [Rhodococcus sp. G-MC3]